MDLSELQQALQTVLAVCYIVFKVVEAIYLVYMDFKKRGG